jgi:hypothetical protein
MKLRATPGQVRSFITAPERILDYYPGGLEGGVLVPGQSIYCLARTGVSLLEVDATQSTADTVVVTVYTARKLNPPYTVESIKSAAFFRMIEDWQIEADAEGTILTKTWRDIEKYRLRFLPLRAIVRAGAKGETQALIDGWNKAAAEQGDLI